MPVFIRHNNEWQPTLVTEQVWGRVNGSWRQGQDMWIRHEGVWKIVSGNNPPQDVFLQQTDFLTGELTATWSLPSMLYNIQTNWQKLISGTWTDITFDNLSAGTVEQKRTFSDNEQIRFRVRFNDPNAPNTNWSAWSNSIVVTILT